MDEMPEEQEPVMHGDEMVNFAGIFTRLPTVEEQELLLRYQANCIVEDEVRLFNLSGQAKDRRFNELVEEERSMMAAASSITEFSNIGIRIATVHNFHISHTVGKTDHSINIFTYRLIIRENNQLEKVDDNLESFLI